MWIAGAHLIILFSFLALCHRYLPRRWWAYASTAVFLVYFSQSLLPGKVRDEAVVCNNHYAIEIPGNEEFHGSYLRCEDFDRYYELMGRHEVGAAKLLLIAKLR